MAMQGRRYGNQPAGREWRRLARPGQDTWQRPVRAFNTGSAFAAEVKWAAEVPQVSLSTDSSLGGGAYFTVPIGPLCLAGCYIIVNPGADYTRSIGRQEAQLRDIDGDGYLDYLTSSDDNEIAVRRNSPGRPTC